MGPSGPGWLPAADRLLVVEPIALHEGVCVPSVCSFWQRLPWIYGYAPLAPATETVAAIGLCRLEQHCFSVTGRETGGG